MWHCTLDLAIISSNEIKEIFIDQIIVKFKLCKQKHMLRDFVILNMTVGV